MKLDERFRIEEIKNNICLIEAVEGFTINKETNEKTPAIKDKTYFYGTVYQALSAYIDKCIKPNESVLNQIDEIIKILDTLKDEIKSEFCVYVKRC